MFCCIRSKSLNWGCRGYLNPPVRYKTAYLVFCFDIPHYHCGGLRGGNSPNAISTTGSQVWILTTLWKGAGKKATSVLPESSFERIMSDVGSDNETTVRKMLKTREASVVALVKCRAVYTSTIPNFAKNAQRGLTCA